MFAVLRRRDFALLWSGQLISLMGDYVLLISIPFFTYQLTGSLLQTGLMFVIETLPRILLGSVAGVFVDRWSRRWTMIVSDLARVCILLLLLLVTARNLLWLLYGVTLLQATCSLFFTPALTAITPTLVDEQHLVGANALQSFSDSVTRFIGPPLGGALFALSGWRAAFFCCSSNFLTFLSLFFL